MIISLEDPQKVSSIRFKIRLYFVLSLSKHLFVKLFLLVCAPLSTGRRWPKESSCPMLSTDTIHWPLSRETKHTSIILLCYHLHTTLCVFFVSIHISCFIVWRKLCGEMWENMRWRGFITTAWEFSKPVCCNCFVTDTSY